MVLFLRGPFDQDPSAPTTKRKSLRAPEVTISTRDRPSRTSTRCPLALWCQRRSRGAKSVPWEEPRAARSLFLEGCECPPPFFADPCSHRGLSCRTRPDRVHANDSRPRPPAGSGLHEKPGAVMLRCGGPPQAAHVTIRLTCVREEFHGHHGALQRADVSLIDSVVQLAGV